MREVLVKNQTRQLKSSLRAGYCDSFFCRLRGLTFRKAIPDDWGLVLVVSRESRVDAAIHMLGVWFDLGIIWISSGGEVVDLSLAKKWVSFLAPKQPARYILEVSPVRLEDFKIGDIVSFE
jgi:uncharacterized membrane protein (UPF0127 family)